MNREIKERWINALRSGQYKQGKQALRTIDDKYCCLGVLCDLYIQENEDAKWVVFNDGLNDIPIYLLYEEAGCLPLQVKEWAGLIDKNPTVEGLSLAQRNDYGETFEEIADLIERNL